MKNSLDVLYESVMHFLTPLTLDKTLEIIAKQAIKVSDGVYASILLEQNGELMRVYTSAPFAYGIKINKRRNTYKSFKTRKPIIKEITRVLNAKEDVEMGIKSTVFMPLSYQDKSIGVITINTKKTVEEASEDLHLLMIFASLASLAIRKTQLYAETKEALETRDLFIAMAAHEFRTPLTTISGYVQLLKSRYKEQDTQDARWVNELSFETLRLTNLVNELLEANRVKNGELHYDWREIRFKEIIKKAIASFNFTHPHREITFIDKLDADEDTIVGDFGKMLQVVGNLLENAVKFSRHDTKIVVTMTFKAPFLNISVKDEGKGIIRKDLSKIFKDFYKADNESEKGLGLGLFLAKNIITKHHGYIRIKSKVDKGTTVELKLPRVSYKYGSEVS